MLQGGWLECFPVFSGWLTKDVDLQCAKCKSISLGNQSSSALDFWLSSTPQYSPTLLLKNKNKIYDEKIKRSWILSSACRTTLNEADEHGQTHDVSLKIAHRQQFSFKSNFLLFVSFNNNSAFFSSVPWSTNQATTTTATVTMTWTAINAPLFDKTKKDSAPT